MSQANQSSMDSSWTADIMGRTREPFLLADKPSEINTAVGAEVVPLLITQNAFAMTPEQLTHANAHAFCELARRLLAEAELLCAETPDSELGEGMRIAKARGMTCVEGLEFTVQGLPRN